ncbi:MAG: MBL fold metallo-hydrolase [Anaerovoracaceae bacterium]|jgi:hydroxyacylglutathione hydrolase
MKIKQMPSGPLMANTYLVWDENSGRGFILDPGGYDPQMVQTVKEEGITVEEIILTHGHADHMGGAEAYLDEYPQAELTAAMLEKPLLADPQLNQSPYMLGRNVVLFPDRTVADGDTMEIGGMKLEFRMTPGHTPGGMCIVIGPVCFSGDTLFRASIGRTDFPGGSYEDLKKSVHEKLFTLPDKTRVFPGHMNETTIGWEKENNPFV